LFAYAERLDGGDLDGVADLFAHATFARAGGPARRGRDEVRSMYDGVVLYDDGTPGTKHVITNVAITVDASGEAAAATSAFTVLQAPPPGGAIVVILAGTYRDRLRRRSGAWTFESRVVEPALVGDLRAHYR
jgi:hypothetical protein